MEKRKKKKEKKKKNIYPVKNYMEN